MGLITARMPRKRSKRSFVDRMLELGIVRDRSECRKRRQRKTKSLGGDGDKSHESSSESENSSSDDENESRPPLRTINVKPKKPSKKKENSKTKKAVSELSASEIAKLLIQAVDSGLTEALKWLAENLEEVALDQEAEGFDPESEGTPLVPISSESVEAMDNPLFVKVLKSIGIAPPSDEQETYWRIPSSIHYDTIRKRREIVMKAVNKELVDTTNDTNAENNAEATQDNNPRDESSDDDDLFDALRKMRDASPQTSNPKSNISSNISSRKRNRSLNSDDENDRKMQKIDEDDSEDILSFAKKTLQCHDLPDTEELLAHSDHDSDSAPAAPRKARRRVISDSD